MREGSRGGEVIEEGEVEGRSRRQGGGGEGGVKGGCQRMEGEGEGEVKLELGIGNCQWGGNWELGMGNGEWGLRVVVYD